MKLVTYDDHLRPGDVVGAAIERIGVPRNPVASWGRGHPEAAALGAEA